MRGWSNKKYFFILMFIQFTMFSFFIIVASNLNQFFDDNLLLKGANDSRYFYELALETKKNASITGFKIEHFFPNDQFPAGVEAFIFHVFDNDNIIYVLILSSFLHLLTTYIYFLIFKTFFSNKISIISSLILHLTPMSAIWYLQHLKESYTCLGFALFSFALLKPVHKPNKYIIMLVSFLLLGASKAYLLIPSFIVLLVVQSYYFFSKNNSFSIRTFLIQVSLLLTVMTLAYKLIPSTKNKILLEPIKSAEENFTKLNYIPLKIDNYRQTYYKTHSGSLNIDQNWRFNTFKDLFLYLPKSAYLGFLSPNFINAPLQRDNISKKVFFQRLIADTCTALFALFIIFFVRARGLILVYLSSLFLIIIIFPYIIPNLGTLSRFKSPFYLIFVGMCSSLFIDYLHIKLKSRDDYSVVR